jgi:hypothetical protein
MQASASFPLFALGVAATAACARTPDHTLEGTHLSPATDGTVQLELVEGDVWLVTLDLVHLPPPARLGEGLTTYVMWTRSDERGMRKVGRIDYSERTRRGHRWTTSLDRSFTLLVTAEVDDRVEAPGRIVVIDQPIASE